MWPKVVVVLGLVAVANGILEGPNVCMRNEPYTTKVRVSEQQPYQEKEYSWCFNVPPRCSKYKVKFRQVYKTQILVKYRPVEECCAGFAPDINGEQCVPVCVDKCVQGKCVAPNTCACDHGYGGPACDISCPKGKWGRNCQNECQCLNGGTCEPLTGECACAPGWRGDACEKACAAPTFGDNCIETCQCKNGSCDPASGACECQAGFTGSLCEDPCPSQAACPQGCRCQNGGECHPLTGKCSCAPGWSGEVCANRCPSGKWGERCERSCECANGASCHHVTGHCHCEAGYTGEKCMETCKPGTFGVDCNRTCECLHGGECSPKDGSCTCKPGWKGLHCELRACPDGKYGARCDRDCECEPANTDLCDPWTGACDCAAGWDGDTCSRQCALLTYGKGCRSSCRCENSGLCSPVNGSCLCAPGFRGIRCEEHCVFPHYGDNCRDTCDCANNATCSHETGQCKCPPGYDGLKCDRPCDGKKYGLKCLQECDCENNAPCNPVNGECMCGPGYTGKRCSLPCPPHTFGQGCLAACDCGAHAQGCHHVTGRCQCDTSWRGVFSSHDSLYYDEDDTAPQDMNNIDIDDIPDYADTDSHNFETNFIQEFEYTMVNNNDELEDQHEYYKTLTAKNNINGLKSISSLSQCVSWNVDFEDNNYDSVILQATNILNNINIENVNAIVAVLDVEDSVFTSRSGMWTISTENGTFHVNNMFRGYLNKLLGVRLNKT